MTMTTKGTYEDLYDKGYGLQFPDGHVIRIYEFFLKYELGVDGRHGERMLDFGCGNGTHPLYFASKGFEVHGVDVVESAIRIANERAPETEKRLRLIEPTTDLRTLYEPEWFDVVFSNQTLHFLSNRDLASRLDQFHSLMKDDGLFIASFHSTRSYYFALNENDAPLDDGLQQVVHRGRLQWDDYWVNFTPSKEALAAKLPMFEPIFIGSYSMEIREGTTDLYYFIGRKR